MSTCWQATTTPSEHVKSWVIIVKLSGASWQKSEQPYIHENCCTLSITNFQLFAQGHAHDDA
jgi:hypothetical protein